jgi:hypothetical protein
MIKRILPFFVFAMFIFSCSDKTESTGDNQTQQTTVADTPEAEALPLPPLQTLEYLFQNCSHIDYVFYELPFSMSLDDKGSIQRTLSHISTSVAPEKPSCKAMGRIFFDVGVETVLEADFYFSEGCVYFIFFEDGKKKYSSYMTPEAVQYMNNYISQANAQRQKLMQNK